MCQQFSDRDLQPFLLFQYLSSDDYKERMALIPPLGLRVAQLKMQLRQNRFYKGCQSTSAAASLLSMHKRLAATDFNR